MDIVFGTTPPEASTVSEYFAKLCHSLETAYALVRDWMKHQFNKQSPTINALVHGQAFGIGDLGFIIRLCPGEGLGNYADSGLSHTR